MVVQVMDSIVSYGNRSRIHLGALVRILKFHEAILYHMLHQIGIVLAESENLKAHMKITVQFIFSLQTYE